MIKNHFWHFRSMGPLAHVPEPDTMI